MQLLNWSFASAFLAGRGIAWEILYYLLLAVFLIYLMRQVRKPTRWVGMGFAWVMNLSHSNLTDWALKNVNIEKDVLILDVGCGGGRTIAKLAALAPEAAVYGVDYAKGSVAASRARNAQLIRVGRAEIYHASVSKLPFADNQFDLVTAIETQYYWPDLRADMREIRRVLKPGGILLIVAEAYKGGRYDKLKGPVMKVLRSTVLSVKEQRELFATAGYTNIEVFEEPNNGWMCAVGKKAEGCIAPARAHGPVNHASQRSVAQI